MTRRAGTVAALLGAALLVTGCSSPPAVGPAPPAATTGPCGDPGAREVSSAVQLTVALAEAGPGTAIRLLDGLYPGAFTIVSAGTPEQPVTLCGSRSAVLDGGPPDGGYALHLLGARHWRLVGFSVRGGQKGVMLDGSSGVLIEGLLVHQVGDEAVHLRTGSSDNVVRRTTIRDTGLRRAEFGEGVYVGSAESNWCRYTGCEPDRSDRNLVEGNDIAATTAEAVDIKEGTSGGVVRDNRFSGDGMRGADSWVDVKGNGWTIAGNTGVGAPADGFQVHAVAEGWGRDNLFEDNVSTVDGPGYGINVTNPDDGNRVACSNRTAGADRGGSNVPCS